MPPTSTGNPPRRGDIWLAELDKPRPVVIMHRDFAGRHLKAVLAAPLTSTIRVVPTAVALGPEDGLDRRCIASMNNLTLVPIDRLAQPIGRLSAERMGELCEALLVAEEPPVVGRGLFRG